MPSTRFTEAEMLRRMASACRNIQSQVPSRKPSDWFDWVPERLEKMADKIEDTDNE